MKNIIEIIKKELKRFFFDKRMLSSLILPGVLIFIVYSLMGNIMGGMTSPSDSFEYQVKVINDPNHKDLNLENVLGDNYRVVLSNIDEEHLEEEKIKLHDNPKETTLIILFSKEFKIEANSSSTVSLFYNSTSTESTTIYQAYYQYIFSKSKVATSLFKVNEEELNYDVATKEDTSMLFLSSLLPFLLLSLLTSGCLAVTTESIAGEKERGTIATLLITPIKRSELAIGKIVSLAIVSLVSALSSSLGLILSLPKLGTSLNIDISMYNFGHYLAIFALVISMILLIICLMSVVSTFAKSVKEAASYSSPVMIILMLVGMTSFISMGKVQTNSALYFIPIYNAIQCFSGVLSLQFNIINFLITICSNLVYFLIGIFVIVKMYNSERIMFNK